MAERVTKNDIIQAVVTPGRVTKRDIIHVAFSGLRQRSTKNDTIHVSVSQIAVVAGPNQTLEAGQPFTLNPVETLNGSTVASRAWKIGSTTVGTSQQYSGVAPITLHGTTVTYTYTVTDTLSRTATSTLVITALPAQIQMADGLGGVHPAIRRAYIP